MHNCIELKLTPTVDAAVKKLELEKLMMGNSVEHKLKFEVNLRPTVSRAVGQSVLVSGFHLEPMTRFLFSV
jgi:hypothetical protein